MVNSEQEIVLINFCVPGNSTTIIVCCVAHLYALFAIQLIKPKRIAQG
jgi:hypothetical protein